MPRDLYASVSLLGGWLLGDKLLGGMYSMNEVLALQAVELILGAFWGAWGPPDKGQARFQRVLGVSGTLWGVL